MANSDNADETQRKGTRCAVCVMCGRCFEEDASASDASEDGAPKWSGTRCDVCVGCGKCAEAWGLIPADGADAESGPTNWADAFKVMDIGTAGAPPAVSGAPGVPASEIAGSAKGKPSKPSNFACLKRAGDGEEPDTSTGATPGVSAACKEHGLADMDALLAERGIKPPGVA